MGESKTGSYLAQLRAKLGTLKRLLSRARAKQVQAKSIKNAANDLVTTYFNAVRPGFREAGLDDESLSGLDSWMQGLLSLSQKAALRTLYHRNVKIIDQTLNGVEVALVTLPLSLSASAAGGLDGKERLIAGTLSALVPSAGLSYEQACLDLRNVSRKSYRGAAAELREALREALDALAAEKDVTSQPGFRLEKDQKKPSMKQKVRFILSSRGKTRSVTAVPENAVNVVADRVGALARSVYDRSSLSTHVGTTKQEVQQIKGYVDVVLGELLEIA